MEGLDWCKCGSCEVQKTAQECFCCQEVAEADTTAARSFNALLNELESASDCICNHSFCKNVCFNKDSLLYARAAEKKDSEMLHNTLIPAHIRTLSYRAFSCWAKGKDIPACVKARIRKEFPSPHGIRQSPVNPTVSPTDSENSSACSDSD